jgi:hypothetical protein
MGNCCDCFRSKQILPVHQPNELKKLEKGDYGLTITIWSTMIEHQQDVRFNFYSKTPELDLILWNILNYSSNKSIHKNMGFILKRNQVAMILTTNEINLLKQELDKYKDLDIKWRKFV